MNKIILFDIDYVLVNTDVIKKKLRLQDGSYDENKFSKNFLYPETFEVLRGLKQQYGLGIWSQGNIEFQKAKLIKSGIINFFDPEFIFISEANKAELALEIKLQLNNKRIYLVDDRLIYLEAFKKMFPRVISIWMKRGLYEKEKAKSQSFQSTYEINNLKEVGKVL